MQVKLMVYVVACNTATANHGVVHHGLHSSVRDVPGYVDAVTANGMALARVRSVTGDPNADVHLDWLVLRSTHTLSACTPEKW